MPILDSLLTFDPAGTAITASAASTNVLDLGVARDLGVGDLDLELFIITSGTFAGAGSTLNVQVQGAPDNGSGAPGTYTTYAESSPLTVSQLNGGSSLPTRVFSIDLPAVITRTASGAGGTALPRFLRLNYVVGVANFTLGTLQAYLALEASGPSNAYPSGFTVAN